MKVAITGAAGMLASGLIKVLEAEYELLLIDLLDSCADRGHPFACVDLTDEKQVTPLVKDSNLQAVFHCAAYTNVDGAQENPDDAYRGNAIATMRIASACRNAGVPLVTVSTDYVFDGTKNGAYKEFDTPNPKSVYGKSKFWAEQLVFQSGARVAVVRTSWLFGVAGRNFVKTMKRLCAEKDKVTVVDDQRGSPTYAVDLAEALKTIGKSLISGRPFEGIWHLTNSGECSWYEFAREIVSRTGGKASVEPVTSKEFRRPAPRPKNSVLDNLRWRLEGLPSQPSWSDALDRYLIQEDKLNSAGD